MHDYSVPPVITWCSITCNGGQNMMHKARSIHAWYLYEHAEGKNTITQLWSNMQGHKSKDPVIQYGKQDSSYSQSHNRLNNTIDYTIWYYV